MSKIDILVMLKKKNDIFVNAKLKIDYFGNFH